MNAIGYFLSFGDGCCRLARGTTLDEAAADAVLASTATQCCCNVLDRGLNVVGNTQRTSRDDLAYTFHSQTAPGAITEGASA